MDAEPGNFDRPGTAELMASSTLSLNTIDFESKKRNCREKQGERNTYNGLATTPQGRRLCNGIRV